MSSFQEVMLSERPDLIQYQKGNSFCVDGYYLFMNAQGEHSWSKSSNAHQLKQAVFLRPDSPEETPHMREVRLVIEQTNVYKTFFSSRGRN